MKARQLVTSLLFGFMALGSFSVQAAVSPALEPVETVASVATVNINTADADTLQQMLSGIGASKAQAIVAYREEYGDFIAVDELLEVKGIGQSILNNNLDKLSVD